MTRLLLVRHGQSTWNADGRWQGWADPPLSELGRVQAERAAGGAGQVDAVVSSDLQRALETAEIMASALGVEDVEVEPDLRERDVGELTGLTRVEIDARWPDLLAPSSGVAAGRSPPGGESIGDLTSRVVRAIGRVAASHQGTVLVVTHGGVVRNLERHLGVEPEPLPNLGGVWVEGNGDGQWRAGERVLLIDPDEVPVTVPRQP